MESLAKFRVPYVYTKRSFKSVDKDYLRGFYKRLPSTIQPSGCRVAGIHGLWFRHKRYARNPTKGLLKWEKNNSSQQSDTSNLPDLEHSFYILPLLWLNWVKNNANSNHLHHSPAWSPHDFPHLFWTWNNPESSIENDCFTVLRLFQILAKWMILIVGFHSKIIFWYLTLVGYKVPGRCGVRPPLPQNQNHLKEIKDSLQKTAWFPSNPPSTEYWN